MKVELEQLVMQQLMWDCRKWGIILTSLILNVFPIYTKARCPPASLDFHFVFLTIHTFYSIIWGQQEFTFSSVSLFLLAIDLPCLTSAAGIVSHPVELVLHLENFWDVLQASTKPEVGRGQGRWCCPNAEGFLIWKDKFLVRILWPTLCSAKQVISF